MLARRAFPSVLLAFVVFRLSGAQLDEERGRFLGALSTITHLSIVTTTSTIPYTCYTSFATTTCGRRKRSLGQLLPHDGRLPTAPALSGSLSEAAHVVQTRAAVTEEHVGERKGRFAVTVWTSVTTTYTMIMTTTNLSTTYSVSILCSVAGATFPNTCG
ncbi:uncharacterized protein LOC108680935 [Hyalella azteca]|uniref:Uncharacterized protein LOC108680935 n=1 Tax=Hyalella azteca TaxID=294128 RepID=A0A8B7PJ33_HYAAZ|nr:uncharacterized protein LOC108680935 [Hyalella azteca]XP_018025356.1 uncharacterized protein LOC108680935 [Hyalella azteca]XP_047739673.1 uncharacterized protein LOC108680935 [Hyalella azteca]